MQSAVLSYVELMNHVDFDTSKVCIHHKFHSIWLASQVTCYLATHTDYVMYSSVNSHLISASAYVAGLNN